jgi:hypothetical protein
MFLMNIQLICSDDMPWSKVIFVLTEKLLGVELGAQKNPLCLVSYWWVIVRGILVHKRSIYVEVQNPCCP